MSIDQLLERININEFIHEIYNRCDFTWQHIPKFSNIKWHIGHQSRLAPLEYIIDNTTLQWDFSEISYRQDLTISFIRHYKNKLNWQELSKNIQFQDIINNDDLPPGNTEHCQEIHQ